MKRPLLVAVAVVLVVGLAASVWGYVDQRRAAARARERLANVHGDLVAARRSSERLSSLLDDERAAAADLAAQLRELTARLEVAEASADLVNSGPGWPGPVQMRTSAVRQHRPRFVPSDAEISSFRVIDGADPRIVVSWARGGDERFPLEEGALVWRSLPIAPGQDRPEWRIEWSILILRIRALPAFIGRTRTGWLAPLSYQRAVPTYGDNGFSVDTGDVTGDGYPEILIADWSSGSGGCAYWRLLSRRDDRLRQILYRAHCEGFVQMIDGLVHIDGALYPEGCENAHGCGSYQKVLRWNGDGWDLVSRTTQLDEAL